jgi:hypothetical protein
VPALVRAPSAPGGVWYQLCIWLNLTELEKIGLADISSVTSSPWVKGEMSSLGGLQREFGLFLAKELGVTYFFNQEERKY